MKKKLMRRCRWCGELYNPEKESSVWCPLNPHRGKWENKKVNTRGNTKHSSIILPLPGILE